MEIEEGFLIMKRMMIMLGHLCSMREKKKEQEAIVCSNKWGTKIMVLRKKEVIKQL